MSIITVSVARFPPQRRTELVRTIRDITGAPIADIAQRLDSGEAVFECTLFLNNHDDVASSLRRLLAELVVIDAAVRVLESGDEITPEVLRNILDEHDRGAQRS